LLEQLDSLTARVPRFALELAVHRFVLPMGLLLGGTACGLFKPKVSDEQRAQVNADLAEAQSRREDMNTAWHDAMTKAYAGEVIARPDLGGCALDVGQRPKQPIRGAPEGFDQMLVQMEAGQARLGMSNKAVFRSGLPKNSPRARMMDSKIEKLRRVLEDPNELRRTSRDADDFLTEAADLNNASWWSWDLIVLVEAGDTVGAVNEAAGTFDAGVVVGRSFVFDYTSQTVACAGVFGATNSDTVEYNKPMGVPTGAAYGAVAFDLEAQALAAGTKAVVRAGPADPKG
jgi:hypothetical protein